MIRRFAPFVLLLAGCHHASAPVLKNPIPSALAAGWTPVSDPASGVSLSLPSGWRVGVPRAFDPSVLSSTSVSGSGEGDAGATGAPIDPQLAQMSQRMQQEDAESEKKILAKLREKEGIVLHCVDGSKPTIAEEPTRLFVKYVPDAGQANLQDAGNVEESDQHRTMKKEIVDLPVGKVMRLTAQGRNRIGDEECHVSYLFLNGSDEYVLRFASTNSPEAILSIERQVADSFRVKPKAK